MTENSTSRSSVPAASLSDMQGGYGAATFERLKDNGITAHAFRGAEKAMGRARDGKLRFTNKRTEAYWRFREALGAPLRHPLQVIRPREAHLESEADET